jgi:hypothetical protein
MYFRNTPCLPYLLVILALSTAPISFAVDTPPPPIPFTVQNFIEVDQLHCFVQGGIPLPKGHAMPDAPFSVTDTAGAPVEAEVKVTAFWPDGSVKWVLVRMQPNVAALATLYFELRIGEGPVSPGPTFAHQDEEAIHVDTGVLRFTVLRNQANLLTDLTVKHDDTWVPMIAGGDGAELIVDVDQHVDGTITPTHFSANAQGEGFTATLEEASPTVAIIRLEGIHTAADGQTFAPYTVRLYTYKSDTQIRLYHTLIFDGDARRDFIRGIGVRIQAAPEEIVGYTLAEARGTGFPTTYVIDPSLPAWRRGILTQHSADAYTIKKVINPETNSRLRATAGTRSQGWGHLETTAGSISAAIRNFWQEYPKAIEVDAVDRSLSAWFYSPHAEALDLRRYSDWGYHSLYEAGAAGPGKPASPFNHDRSNATGISKSSELLLDFAPLGAPAARCATQALLFQRPPLLRASPEWMGSTGVFGHIATVPESGPGVDYFHTARKLHMDEQERNRWYSFIDYGDVMHSFNPAKDLWRFDEGGYAWLNNEGQISDGYWMAYLATGEERTYRFAEAMTRHVQDVDMFQIGPLAGRGMRHNVNHWGGTNRERRMTIAQNKRIYHFLSGDEHTADRIRFGYEKLPKGGGPINTPAMDFAVGATALLYLWESTGEVHYGETLQRCAETFCANPIGGYGFPAQFQLDLATGEGSIPDGTAMLADYFLTFFGPLRVLMETSNLTGNTIITERLLKWASLMHEPEDFAKEHQLHFGTDVQGAYSHLHVAAFAYRHTGDRRYLDVIRQAFENPALEIKEVGGDGPLQRPRHNAIHGQNSFQTNSNSITLYNFPYAFPLLGELDAALAVGE